MSTEDAGRKKKKKSLLLAMSNSNINTGQRDGTDGRRADKQWPLTQVDRREATEKRK